MLCIATFETTPLTVTVCPTCSARATWSLFRFQVLPSLPFNTNSFALSPLAKQPLVPPYTAECCKLGKNDKRLREAISMRVCRERNFIL